MTLSIQPVDLLQRPSFKPVKLVPALPPKGSWLSRHITWIREERHGLKKVAVVAWAALEAFILMTSVIGVVILVKAVKEWKRQEAEVQYFKQAEQARRPASDLIEIKTPTRTFNHVHDFALESGTIWSRLRNSRQEWKPVYFEGYERGEVPQAIGCDGANLIAVDQNRHVHYKKVLKEFRNTDIHDGNRRYIEQADVNLNQDSYIAVDKSTRNNWKEAWCTLPYWNLHFFSNLLTGKRLKLPPEIKTWAISHRGLYNHLFQDRLDRTHIFEGGTTTLYGLHQNGRDIIIYDPWSPQLAHIEFPLPETPTQTFTAEEIYTSASTIMVMGYEQTKGSETKTLSILTWLADIDTIGWNPFAQYSYFSPSIHSSDVAIPFPSWQAHPLTLEENSFITKQMSIVQTGEGNEARELRIVGTKLGQAGIYYKKINEANWHFIASQQTLSSDDAVPLTKPIEQPFNTTVHSYRSQNASFSHSFQGMTCSARLLNFGQRSLQPKVEITIDGQVFLLDVFRNKSLFSYLGFPCDTLELVVPEALHQVEPLRSCLQQKTVLAVNIREQDDRVILESKEPPLFSFTFEREAH